MRHLRQPEKGEQRAIIQLLNTVRAKAYVSGTRRRRGSRCPNCGTFVPEDQRTRQSPGIPDVEAFLPKSPAAVLNSRARRLLKIEVKAPGRGLEPEQAEYRDLCRDAEIDHIHGGLDQLIHWLVLEGYLREDQVAHYRLPSTP